jgi:uncharacterized membrane protein
LHPWLPLAVTALAVAWVAALVFAPFLPVPAAAVMYAAGSLICHQLPDRSFHLESFQLPVCARCFGVYVGGAIGPLAVTLAPMLRRGVATAGRRYWVTLAAAVPTAATAVLEHGLGWPLSNHTRALAAVPLTAVVAVVVVGAIHYDECTLRRPIVRGQPQPPASM